MFTPFEYRSMSLLGCLAMVAAGIFAYSDTTAPPVLTVSAVAASNGQSAPAGEPLPLPLRVLVQSNGAAKAGVTVRWQASAGTIMPTESVTDASGQASATWTLGAVAGDMTVSTNVDGAQGSPLTFHATATAPHVSVVVVPASDGQTGTVGTALAQPLQVQVDTNGAPKAGVWIQWHTFWGSVVPQASITDSNGIASATWTLGTNSGLKNAYATMAGATSSQAFSATALPGPAAAIERLSGSDQTSPANGGPFSTLVVRATDLYGNPVEGEEVIWTITSGPVAFVRMGGATSMAGLSTAVVEPTGATGDAVVRAVLSGVAASADFALAISPRTYDVALRTSFGYKFVSSQNGSGNPAVDTIPAGSTMTWTLEVDLDPHGVESVGVPSFTGGDFTYANPTVSVTFRTRGRYSYRDPYHPTARGVVVVQ